MGADQSITVTLKTGETCLSATFYSDGFGAKLIMEQDYFAYQLRGQQHAIEAYASVGRPGAPLFLSVGSLDMLKYK